MHSLFYIAVLTTSIIGVRCALDSLCDTNEDCTVTNSYCKKELPCSKGMCVCNRNYKTKNVDTCIKDVLVDQSCASTEECPDGGGSSAATCSGGVCKCPSGYEPYTKQPNAYKRCNKIPEKLEAACDYSADKYCGYGATCDASKCKCSSGTKADGDFDCRAHNFKESCTTNSTCATHRAECKSAVCDCTESGDEYHERDGLSACLPPTAKVNLALGDQCDMANFKYCGPHLICTTCPEDIAATNPVKVCLDGCSGLQASITLLILLLAVYFTL